LESFSSQLLKLGDILLTSGRHFPITTSTPVPISIILNKSHLDAGSLIQAVRNEKALRRIQKKIMRARSTLDWSQSNNISCSSYDRHGLLGLGPASYVPTLLSSVVILSTMSTLLFLSSIRCTIFDVLQLRVV